MVNMIGLLNIKDNMSKVTKNSSDRDEYWMKRFEESLQKTSVQSREMDKSIFDQINSIMNGSKSKYTSVEAAVEDMKERSGLTAYLNKIKVSKEEISNLTTKKASNDSDLPLVIKKRPQIQHTIENYIRDTKGNLSLPAIIEKIKSLHKRDIADDKDWDEEKLFHYISKMNLQAKKDNPNSYESYNNLGSNNYDGDDIDPSNSDVFHALMPAKT